MTNKTEEIDHIINSIFRIEEDISLLSNLSYSQLCIIWGKLSEVRVLLNEE